MRKLTVYEIDVVLRRNDRPVERHDIWVAARNVTTAFSKAQRRLNEGPHGIQPVQWALTGKYRVLRKIFI
jgi:hypothetical protein